MDETQQQITARIVAETAKATAQAVQDAAIAAAGVLAHDKNQALTAIAVLQTETSFLKLKLADFETTFNCKMDKLDAVFEKIFEKLDDVALGRPSWAVTIILAALSSLCVGLLTFIVSHRG